VDFDFLAIWLFTFLADYKLPNNWPQSGVIKMEDMSLRYGSTDNPVLKNIDCTIQSHEKVNKKNSKKNALRQYLCFQDWNCR